MSTRDKRTTKTPIVPVEKNRVLPSLAFKKLSGNAFKLYIVMRSETFGYLYGNPPDVCSTDIKMAYTLLMQATGFSSRTISRCFVELENKGFLDQIKQGGFYAGGKQVSVYRLSMRFLDYETAKFEHGKMKLKRKKKIKADVQSTAEPLCKVQRKPKQKQFSDVQSTAYSPFP